MDGMSLLDVLRGVMLDPAEQAAYNADPGAYLGRYGYDDVDAADLSEAFGLVADTLPPDQAQAAWEAAATPDGGSFGPVTADFDNVGGPAPAGDAAPPAEEAPDDTVPELSFGQGEDGASGLGDPDDPDDLDDGLGGPDTAPGEDGGFDADDLAFDSGGGAEGVTTDLDDDLRDPDDAPEDTDDAADAADGGGGAGGLGDLDEAPPLGHGTDDDGFDDLGQIDGLDALGDAGPDDTDIGSF
jgi:hypothetical protein